jgi:hypothetical protein
MKYINIILLVIIITLTSCVGGGMVEIEESEKVDNMLNMDVLKFEFDGNHYIKFENRANQGMSIVLDPNYLFDKDTIDYKGEIFIRIEK